MSSSQKCSGKGSTNSVLLKWTDATTISGTGITARDGMVGGKYLLLFICPFPL